NSSCADPQPFRGHAGCDAPANIRYRAKGISAYLSMKSLWALSRSALDRRDAGLSWRDQLSVMRRVMPYLWPEGPITLKLRVVAAFSLIVVGKVVSVLVPVLYKEVV